MKVLLLAGGLGTRISEETVIRPKPMVEIGGKPILWHIMKLYAYYGFSDFTILLGYKGIVIKEYFTNYFLHHSDLTVDLRQGSIEVLNNSSEPWKITLLDTGVDTMTGGRVRRARELIGGEPFMLTYGDGVSDVNIEELVNFHRAHGKAMTMTSAQPDGRFGALNIVGNQVKQFMEKPKGDGGWVNAGFFVCEPKVFDYIQEGDDTVFEQEPLQQLALDGEIMTFKHSGFWKPMDSLKDKNDLNEMWAKSQAAWKVWND